MQPANDSRRVLVEALRDALSGRDWANAQFDNLMADWRALSQAEKSALLQLNNWAEDRPLRTQFVRHAEYSERRLESLLLELEAAG